MTNARSIKPDAAGKDGATGGDDEPPADKLPSAGLRGLLTFSDSWDKLAFVYAAVSLCGFGVTMVSFLFFVKPFFTDVAAAESAGGTVPMETVEFMARMIMVLGGAQFFIAFFGFSAANISAGRQKRAWQKAVVRAILSQDVGWFDVSKPEELTEKFGKSILLIHRALEGPSFAVFMAIAALLTGFVGGFVENVPVALVVLATVPLLAFAVALIAYVMVMGGRVQSRAYARAGGIATEALFAMRTVASLGLERIFVDKYCANLAPARNVTISARCKLGLATGILFSAFIILQAAGFIYGGFTFADELERSSYVYTVDRLGGTLHYCAHANNTPSNVSFNEPCAAPSRPLQMNCQMAHVMSMFDARGTEVFGTNLSMLEILSQDSWETLRTHSLAQATAYAEENPSYWKCSVDGAIIIITVMFVMQGSFALGQVAQPLQQITAAIPAANTLLSIVQRVSAIDSFDTGGETLASVKGDIEVKDVVFAYPSAPDHNVCNGYTLSITAGQTVALSGASGSGKSTVIQLIERFYDPLSGSITLDGADIKTLNVKWLRSQLGLVSQEPVLFQGTVADNILYGKPDATQSEIEEAARNANAHKFITERLNDGYNTEVGQGGSKLSGGQKQRVAIARALIKQPSVLLLDEATSALDNESERIVQAALDEIMTKQKRTTVVIAHRLSTIRNADKIAVVDKGAVVEEGTYDELLAIGDGGYFFTLAKKQSDMGAQDLRAMDAAREAVGGDSAHKAEAFERPSSPKSPLERRKSRWSKEKLEGGEAATGEKGPKAGASAKDKAPVGRLFGLQKESAGFLLFGVIFACGSGGLPLFGFYTMLNLFTVFFQLAPQTIKDDTFYYGTLLFGTIGGVIFCFWADTACFGVAAARLTYKLRRVGFKAFLGQDIGFFDAEEHSAGALTAFLSDKATVIEFLTGGQLQAMLRGLACMACIVTFSAVFGAWQIMLYVLAAFPLMGVLMGLVMMAAVGDQIREQQGKEAKGKAKLADKDATQVIGECVLAIRTVASFNAEHHFVANYNKKLDRLAKLESVDAVKAGAAIAIGMSLFMVMMGGMNYYGGYLISIKAITFQEMMTPMFMMMGGMIIMISAALGVKDVPTATAAAKLFFEATDRAPKIEVFGEEGTTLRSVKGDIEVKDVVFAYPTAVDHLVCNGYTLSITAGQTVALSGASGSGKSTVIQLIERFYDPLSGSITLDGADIKTLNVKWLRSQLGLVSQEPVLFQGTVADNILYGKPDATQSEIEEAARNANAHSFITSELVDGYTTDVGIRGGKLSGGQKQRVAIARALVRQPSVLLLDEATSALDNESERIVQAALDEIMTKQKRTTVVIAHRLSTIRNADKIAVLKEGKVAEQGTHDELLANPEGLYFSLVLAS